MATEEHEVTDRHDESDREQFGNDHNLDGTHFIATHCHNCGTYVVKAPEAPDAYCIDCRRALAGIDWQSGDNIGEWQPGHRLWPPTPTETAAIVNNTINRSPRDHTEWRWGCIYCRETGQADNPTHAEALHKIHLGYACPGVPGISTKEIHLRIARRKAREKLYPEDVPPFTPKQGNTNA